MFGVVLTCLTCHAIPALNPSLERPYILDSANTACIYIVSCCACTHVVHKRMCVGLFGPIHIYHTISQFDSIDLHPNDVSLDITK